MPALIQKILIVKHIPIQENNSTVINLTSDIVERRSELPIKGCIDFTIYNLGTAKAYLFQRNIEILPGSSWTPAKSATLPYANQPIIEFEGSYELTRNISDLSNTQANSSN